MSHRVLVTGSAGVVGRHVVRELRGQGHWVRGYDIHPMPDWVEIDQMQVGNLADGDALRAACEGVDTIVHLGATPVDSDFMSKLLPNNIMGVYNICEAARQCGVKRLILTSTVQTVLDLGVTQRRITLADGVAPSNHYALAKFYAEQMGEMYARMHSLSVLAVRLGWVPHVGRENPQIPEVGEDMRVVYISPRDAGRAFACAVTGDAPAAGNFRVVFFTGVVADDRGTDPAPAHDVIGFAPRDTWPDGIPSDL